MSIICEYLRVKRKSLQKMVSKLAEERRMSSENSQLDSARNSIQSLCEIKEMNGNNQMPFFKMNVSMAISCNQIIDLFSNVALKFDYNLIERDHYTATATIKSKSTFKKFFFKCLPFVNNKDSQKFPIKIFIGYDEKKCKRTITIQDQIGEAKVMKSFIKDFTRKIEKMQKLKRQKYSPFQTSLQQQEEDEETIQVNIETSSYYQFHKILSQESYNLGKSMSSFIETFNQQY